MGRLELNLCSDGKLRKERDRLATEDLAQGGRSHRQRAGVTGLGGTTGKEPSCDPSQKLPEVNGPGEVLKVCSLFTPSRARQGLKVFQTIKASPLLWSEDAQPSHYPHEGMFRHLVCVYTTLDHIQRQVHRKPGEMPPRPQPSRDQALLLLPSGLLRAAGCQRQQRVWPGGPAVPQMR